MAPSAPTSVMWFRRDLRLRDHPALQAAADGARVLALFVLDDALLRPSGSARVAFLLGSLRALDADLREHGGRLIVRSGRPEQVVPDVVAELGAAAVHISADYAPYGAARDERVAAALGEVPLVRTGSPYAVAPGRVTTADGRPYQVYSAFYRSWRAHGWRAPATSRLAHIDWLRADGIAIPDDPELPDDLRLPEPGEAAAHRAWRRFHPERYADERDRPDLDHTSRLSPYLKFGAIHPRTLLAKLGPEDEVWRRELAWREFYAAVLHFWPDSAREYFRPELRDLPYATGKTADERFAAWAAGRTGFPIVDAGMRQLRGEGWMHNRVRMITASFLVKDLHIEWTRGARHFMRLLVDGDLASNQHGWQWTAGTGTDAAPYFRIFNPIRQGEKFDPDGAYIRRWVPELESLPATEIHEPWARPDGPPAGYPSPVVDHAEQRAASLAAYQELRRR
jgi:deoxyribodipyrimidine photo-lyase